MALHHLVLHALRRRLPQTDPDIIDGSRRQRIATGSGVQPNEVRQLLDQFGQMRRMMKQFAGFGTKKMNPKSRSKGKKGKKRRGGRVTEKGGAKVARTPLSLPGLEEGLPGLK